MNARRGLIGLIATVLLGACGCVGQVGGGGERGPEGAGPEQEPPAPAGVNADAGAGVGRDDAGAPGESGTGGGAGAAGAGGASDGAVSTLTVGDVVISEIMYHAVGEEAAEDHEFIELHNRGATPVSLQSWTLRTGGKNAVAFTFPTDARIAAGEYRVLAKSRKALAAVTEYGLLEANLWGDYQGNLDNGGATLTLRDAAGAIVDAIKYDDASPWPIASDALGVGQGWLPAGDSVLRHKFRGRSLERIDVASPGNTPANWEASPLDRMTPGRANTVKGSVLPIVATVQVAREDGTAGLLRAADRVSLRVRFTDGVVGKATVRWFEDDPNKPAPAATSTPMVAQADGSWRVILPPKPDQTIVRFQIWAERGGQPEARLSPRVTDPFAWHAYFVSPVQVNDVRRYHLFIRLPDWTRLGMNIDGGAMVDTCTPKASWNDRVPATFVFDGTVYDVRVRYSGSRFHRFNGVEIPTFDAPKPALPSPLKALSFSVSFPRYAPFGDKRKVSLNKMNNHCSGVESFVMSRVFAAVGTPATTVRFARLYVNGAYYRYVTEIEPVSEQTLRRSWPDAPSIGDIIEADGNSHVQGPWGAANFGPMGTNAMCPQYTVVERYEKTYKRTHPEWKRASVDEIVKLIGELAGARSSGLPATRTFFEKSFDLPRLHDYMAIINWAASWDDAEHNHVLYRDPAAGKWLVLPWDFDTFLGAGNWPYSPVGKGSDASTASFFMGSRGGGGDFSFLKDAYTTAFAAEYAARLKTLAQGVLEPRTMKGHVDAWKQSFSLADWQASPPTAKFCDPIKRESELRAWIDKRDVALKAKFP